MSLAERFSSLAIAAVVLGLSVPPAWASFDSGLYTPKWNLRQSTDSQYNNQPFLSPSNDSRVNLLLMLLDEGHAKFRPPSDAKAAAVWSSATPVPFSDFTELLDTEPVADQAGTALLQGEGSRCVSNQTGIADFQAALAQAKDLPAAELTALSEARRTMTPSCAEASDTKLASLDAVQSATGRQFGAYLTGAAAFYDSKLSLAEEQFSSLRDSNQPWLKEAALYMLGRAALNLAQFGAFDKDDGLLKRDKVNAAALATAKTRLQAYLDAYPQGKYVASARGLMRRVTWLGGDFQKLSDEFAFQLDHAGTRQAVELTAEVDLKLMSDISPATTRDVRLLAMWDLVQIRHAIPASKSQVQSEDSDEETDKPVPFELSALTAQKPSFAGHEDLFDYLLAAHAFYDDKQPAKVLALLPAAAPTQPMTFLAFSRQVLRGLALEASGDTKGARKHWQDLLAGAQAILQRPTVELALAMNYERAGEVAALFAPASPIRDTALRQILLTNSADAGVLRQTAKAADATPRERALAAFTLLRKDLLFKGYRAFGEDLALVPKEADALVPNETDDTEERALDFKAFEWPGASDDYKCPSLTEIARTLAQTPDQTAGQICLGEFYRLSDPGDFAKVPTDELGGASKPFAGKSFARQEVYQRIIADPKAKPTDRAYALYRAIHCYEPVGNNACGGADAPKRQRAKWFRMLKSDYPESEWAKTPYYW